MADTNFYPLTIKAVDNITPDAVVVSLEIPEDQKEKFEYLHGQYITLQFNLKGKKERRAYSLCSCSAFDKNILKVGVKRVKGGLVSNHICDNLKAGQTIDVMPPQGNFCVKTNPDAKKDYVLVGAGSGITPLYSIAQAVIEQEPQSRVFVYYGNRKEESIMFYKDFDALQKRYKGQLVVQHILSKPKTRKEGGFLGFFAKTVMDWKGEVGRIDAAKFRKFLDKHIANNGGRETIYFTCGPQGMMDAVFKVTEERGVDKKNVHREWFVVEDTNKDSKKVIAGAGNATLHATLNGEKMTIAMQENETIVDAMMREEKDPPFSCMSGACSTCRAKVLKGKAEMEQCLALDDDELAQGYILTCAAIPTTDEIEVDFDA